ncbi:helix-turn-helix transcriptional regulator [Elizabethkingia miricola]|uniref:Helix-turn-helix transcriptional regulator n=1 Tax=Elizabethkingia miricola TaxID=172045 RepID=A0ABD5B3K9_ELIMR|nr:helix-turn-helix transcriptional regulator [Elizabethkingia miricola]MDQ8748391.1 helix-turn-helix transcriptional regulator [Elizabethkingia miricola]
MEKKKLNRIKIVLVEKGISQKELAEYLKTGVVSVSRWCNNEAQPSLETFYRISEYLEVDVCELLIKKD